jgi:hypothetical protein
MDGRVISAVGRLPACTHPSPTAITGTIALGLRQFILLRSVREAVGLGRDHLLPCEEPWSDLDEMGMIGE